MTGALQIGPLAMPVAVLFAFAAIGLGGYVGRRLGRAAGIDTGPLLLQMLLLGLLAARLAFVWQWRGPYLEHPLSILDLRDGGWAADAGFVVAALYGFLQARRQPRLRTPVFGALIAAVAVQVGGSVLSLTALRVAPPLPALVLSTIDGRPVALDAFRGKPTVVNLWASWCGPCVREMPLLQQAQASRAAAHFVFVNQGENAATIEAYLVHNRLALRNVLVDARLQAGSLFDQRALPTTLFFDAGGRLVSTRIGELSEAVLEQRLSQVGAVAASP